MAENTADFTITGVDSVSEARDIEERLKELDGVMAADVDRENGDTTVRFDYDLLSEERVRNQVRDAGYEIE